MKYITHEIAIPVILEVGLNKIDIVGNLVKKAGFIQLVLFFDPMIYQLLGEKIISSLHQHSSLNILQQNQCTNNKMKTIMEMAFTLPPQTQVIIGIGGGMVLDLAKYIAFLNNLPFISIPTSTSHDGFASSGCSLVINNRRTSVPAKMPYGIIIDLGVVKNSPDKFIYSGIGDIISKITAVQDWLFEEAQGKATTDDFAVMIAKKSVNSVARIEIKSIKEFFFLKELVDSLTLSGVAMEIAGSSAPASGSEHLISHALDQLLDTPQLHGIQVGIATYLMSKVQDYRYQRVAKFLQDTGFFAYAKTLGMKAGDFAQAIDLAPAIKPNRHTYLHLEENREKAKRLLKEDSILQDILL